MKKLQIFDEIHGLCWKKCKFFSFLISASFVVLEMFFLSRMSLNTFLINLIMNKKSQGEAA